MSENHNNNKEEESEMDLEMLEEQVTQPEETSTQESTALLEKSPRILDDEGQFCPDWCQHYEDLKPIAKSLAKFRRPEALAKSYAELERMRSYPGEDQPERMGAFRRLVGLPETVEEFHLEKPEDMSEEHWNAPLAEKLGQVAYTYGVPAVAMKAMTRAYAQEFKSFMDSEEQQQEEAIEETREELKSEWGRRFDQSLEQTRSVVMRLSERCGVDPNSLLNSPVLSSNADFIRIMHEAAVLLDEAPMRTSEGHVARPQDEARRIESDPQHPLHEAYMKTNHPNHKYANQLYDKLAFGK